MSSQSSDNFNDHQCHRKQPKQFDVDSSNYIFATPRSKFDPSIPQQSNAIKMYYTKGTMSYA